MSENSSSSKGRIGWIAVIGVTVSVLTFLYNRYDKHVERTEKTQENRPIVEVVSGTVTARAPNVERELWKSKNGGVREFRFGTEKPTMPIIVVTIVLANHGNRIAGNMILESERLKSPLMFRDINPDETQVEQRFFLSEGPFTEKTRLQGTIHYSDKVDPTRKFDENFCFEMNKSLTLAMDAPPTGSPPVPYNPPLAMFRCEKEITPQP